MTARGRRIPGQMNKLEAAYAQHLEFLRSHGEIMEWHYEAVTLRIADNCRYTPDFMLVLRNLEVEFRETKGFMRDDARVKLRVAADLFPRFRFLLVTQIPKRDGGGWDEVEIKAGTQVVPPSPVAEMVPRAGKA